MPNEIEIIEPGKAAGGDPANRVSVSVSAAIAEANKPAPAHYRIGRKLGRALNEIVHGAPSITAAAERVGMTREGLSLALGKPHVIAELERRVRIQQAARGAKAMFRLEHLMDNARSEYVQLEAAKATADRSGYGVNQKRTDTAGGLVINIDLG